jgi:hypothetical protein
MFAIKLLTVCLRLFDTFFLWCVNTCNNVNYMYKTECILVGSHNCSLNCVWHYNSKYWIGILPLVLWSPYPWYYDPLPMVFWHPIHDNLNPLSMIFWTPYSSYVDPLLMAYEPLIDDILNPLPMIFWPLPMVFYLSFHGISLHNLW